MNTPLQAQETALLTIVCNPNNLTGSLLADRYRLVELLGSGGMGVVYKALHTHLLRTFAIKLLHPKLIESEQCLSRFRQEARAASQINHEGVIAVHDFGITASGQPYLVMDYIEGHSLEHVLKNGGALAPQRCLNLFLQVALALAEAHSRGVIHRDLKPSNIMLLCHFDAAIEAEVERVKIVDFGIAKIVSESGSAHTNVTRTGEVFGSPPYMSPEQCRGLPLDQRSDIYSFGCVLYESLSGQAPISGANMLETMFLHLHQAPPPLPLATAQPHRFAKLEEVIFKCLAKESKQRYQNMHEVQAALLQALDLSDCAGPVRSACVPAYRLLRSARLKLRTAARASFTALICVSLMLALSFAAAAIDSFGKLIGGPTGPVHFGSTYCQPETVALPENYTGRELAAKGPLDSLRRQKGVSQRSVAMYWLQVGDFHKKYHCYVEAANEYQRCDEIMSRGSTEWLPVEIAAVEKNEADCHFALKDYPQAKKLYLKAHFVIGKILGQNDPYLAEPFRRLADICIIEGDLRRARQYEATAIAIMESNNATDTGAEHLSALCDCAEIDLRGNDFYRALKTYEKALQYWNQFNGAQRKSAGFCQFNIALCQLNLGHKSEAANSFKQSIASVRGSNADTGAAARLSMQYARELWRHNWRLDAIALACQTQASTPDR